MTSFESMMEFSEFHLNEEGLLPVIAQSYKTGEVLMFSYMDKEAFTIQMCIRDSMRGRI